MQCYIHEPCATAHTHAAFVSLILDGSFGLVPLLMVYLTHKHTSLITLSDVPPKGTVQLLHVTHSTHDTLFTTLTIGTVKTLHCSGSLISISQATCSSTPNLPFFLPLLY